MLIGELAARTGVSRRSLRYYEQQGLLTSMRGGNGYRDYGESAVDTVRRIRALLAAGLPTETIRQALPCVIDTAPTLRPCPELVEVLRSEMGRMDAMAAELVHSRELIARMLVDAGVSLTP
ncbi:MerR family transcriptional regulator [Nocardia alni]|uniref:MerR family transcriptional regulator n=1 Tax=Nocardia alni TaxID=2815723 RepID=UPI001C225141|nr:MerR family transcriptional regulator [Nocardia alni]